MYERAITELEIALTTAETNAPIWENEGNPEQAQSCRERAESFKAAIQKLTVTELDLQHRGSSD